MMDFPIIYPRDLPIDLNFLYSNRFIAWNSFYSNIEFIDFFPQYIKSCLYIDGYSNNIESIEPSNRMNRLFSDSINFNTHIFWSNLFPVNIYDDFLIFASDSSFRLKYPYQRKSLHVREHITSVAFDHHDFYNRYILTNNYYVTNIARNFINHLPGFFICYYQPTATIEAVLQPIPSIFIENMWPLWQGLATNLSTNIIIREDDFKIGHIWTFFDYIKQIDFELMQKNKNMQGIVLRIISEKN